MPNPWNDSTDRKLLLTIIHLQGRAGAPKWDQLAGLMGEGFTAESTRYALYSKKIDMATQLTSSSQHFQAIRKKAEAEFGPPNAPSSTPAAKGTPRSRKKVADGQTPSKPSRKRKGAAEEDDAEESEASPTKKQNVKTEAQGGSE